MWLRTQACITAMLLCTLACGPAGITSETGESSPESTQAESDASGTASSTSATSESSVGTESTTTPPSTTVFIPDEGNCCGGESDAAEWGVRCTTLCDMILQDCPEGEKCVPYASTEGPLDSHKCVPVLGELGPGQACILDGFAEATDDCDGSSYCVAPEDGPGYCRSFCTPGVDVPECPAGMECTANWIEDDFVLCVPTCELPELSAGCDIGEACYLWPDDPLVCLPAGSALPGQGCAGANGCVAENYCVDGTLVIGCVDESCCAPSCDLNDGGLACALLPGSECVALFEPGLGPDNHGICLDPAALP